MLMLHIIYYSSGQIIMTFIEAPVYYNIFPFDSEQQMQVFSAILKQT